MYETVFDNGGVVVWIVSDGSVCIEEAGDRIYLKPEELASIGEAVATYLKRKTELEYEKFAWAPTGET